VDFTQANLQVLIYSYAILKNAKLRNADLTKVKLDWADVEGADLRGAKLSREQYDRLANRDKAKLSRKDLNANIFEKRRKENE